MRYKDHRILNEVDKPTYLDIAQAIHDMVEACPHYVREVFSYVHAPTACFNRIKFDLDRHKEQYPEYLYEVRSKDYLWVGCWNTKICRLDEPQTKETHVIFRTYED